MSTLLKSIVIALVKKLVTMVSVWASDDMAEWLIKEGGKKLVKSTKTDFDDNMLRSMIESYEYAKYSNIYYSTQKTLKQED